MAYYRRQTTGFLIGAVTGSFIAATTALLLAPKSGYKLRRDIADKYQGIRKQWM